MIVKFKNPAELLGPCDFVCLYTPRKAASAAETLAFRQKFLTSLQFLLGAFAVVDVGIEPIPRRYLTFRITHCAAARLYPSINTISASIPLLNLVGLARFDRLSPCLDDSGKVVRVNDIDARPVFQFLAGLAEILQDLLIE